MAHHYYSQKQNNAAWETQTEPKTGGREEPGTSGTRVKHVFGAISNFSLNTRANNKTLNKHKEELERLLTKSVKQKLGDNLPLLLAVKTARVRSVGLQMCSVANFRKRYFYNSLSFTLSIYI